MTDPAGRKYSENETNPHRKDSSGLIRILFNAAGTFSLGLGLLGIVTPLLPTTPFLLLSAACYYRGSDRMHNWLINHRVFGKYIRDYIDKRAIPGRIKTNAISLLWITIGVTAVFFVDSLIARIILLVIAILVTIHLMMLRTMKE
ncbi:YbaN family protein [candidate division KSB1 bacterium]